MTAEQSHQAYMKLIIQHGTDAEKTQLRENLEVMRQMRADNAWLVEQDRARGRDTDLGSGWQWMEEIRLIEYLAMRCEGIAQARVARAQALALRDKHGTVRSIEDETRSTKAQIAAMLMIGRPLTEIPANQTLARVRGNIGGDVSAFCPRPGSTSLIVGEKEPDDRRMILIHEVTDNVYEWRGWEWAHHVKQPHWQREFDRNGVTSMPYLIPPEMLLEPSRWQ